MAGKIEKKSPKSDRRDKNGGARRGAGRPKGVRNRLTQESIAAAQATGETPLEYLLRVMRDPDADPKRRDAAARDAAPYIHPRLASLTHNGEVNVKVWTDEQLAVALPVLRAVAAHKPG